ncbi:hypothetical protein AMATHDRAFT_7417 [Amanita thiersii Skay4041]|uniref:Major facilitator superfamily (MFS) profile domain-containing protein n=1 Tax=Amanita thiersii Skay4041 TaxID=703135 RepID=A0A2A9NG80_9AGAR|nr:hypothetical protein AMATHDRAFT_7417 [Amanita thiersii Skay4041]
MDTESLVTNNEGTALLPKDTSKTRRTPLPKLPIAILLTLHFCDPITNYSISPYINQLIGELDITGGDERKVGYYAGMIFSGYFAAQAISVLFWTRASDTVGRKPILLFGLICNAVSMLLFGFSRTFWMLFLSRSLSGLLDANLGVTKSVMGDLTDSTNRADGFALLPAVWAAAATIGPLIGGSFSRPYEQFPEVFGTEFWKRHPYLLPCIVVASFVLVTVLLTVFFFKETSPAQSRRDRSRDSIAPEPVPLRKLLTYPVIISVSNYAVLSCLDTCSAVLFPLFMAMPTRIGGMGYSPAVIGSVLSFLGAFNGIYQTFCFARIVRRFGERCVFFTAMLMLPLIAILFMITGIISKNNGPTWLIRFLLITMLGSMTINAMAYSCILLYVTTSAPNKRSLGATNGLSQATASFTRAIGPALIAALFSWSVENNLLGGYAVYIILFVCSCLALPLAACLPQQVWEEHN